MKSDLFYDIKCKCGNGDSNKFERLKPLKVKRGLDWLCKCLACGTRFRIQWTREA
jgi:hypothetical protein